MAEEPKDKAAYLLYCQLCDEMKIAGPTSYPNDHSKVAPRDANTDQKIIDKINAAFAGQAIRTMNEVRDDLITPARQANVKAERWQEVSMCENLIDGIATKIKALKKAFNI